MKDSFKEKGYKVIKQVVNIELCTFIHDYFLLKRQVAKTFFETRYISPYTEEYGVFGDGQCPNSYAHYSDVAMEILLVWLKPLMEKEIKEDLYPTYSYARIYDKGNVLEKHKDRFSCEISTTLNLGGDLWPIFLEDKKGKQIKISLNKGDMLIYKGNELFHWREPLEKDYCVQVFLHYNKISTDKNKKNFLDTRPHLGLPVYFKKNKNDPR